MQDKLMGRGNLATSSSDVPNDLEMGRTKVTQSEMGGFFTEVGAINGQLQRAEQLIEQINQTHTQALAATLTKDYTAASQQAEQQMNECGRLLTATKSRVELLSKDVENRKRNDPSGANTRMASSMYGTVSQKLLDIVGDYTQVQETCKAKYREKIERQVKIVNPGASSDDVDRMISQGGNVFEQEMMRSGQAQLRDAYLDAEEKTKELHRIEAQLIELRQMFVDLQALVLAQGEMLDTIESNVSKAVAYTHKGVEQIVKADKSARSARKKMCCLAIFFLILLIVLVAVFAR